jgi:hypothetical protein
MRIILVILMFFIVWGLFLISNNNLALYNQEDTSTFKAMYSEWLGQLFNNSKGVVGNVVKLEWLPTNVSGNNS